MKLSNPLTIVLLIMLALMSLSCKPQYIKETITIKDSSIITYKDTLIVIPEVQVSTNLNDSLLQVLHSLKPNEKVIYKNNNAELKFWRNTYGELVALCTSKEDSLRLVLSTFKQYLNTQKTQEFYIKNANRKIDELQQRTFLSQIGFWEKLYLAVILLVVIAILFRQLLK